jgi:glutathione S-transferase
MLSRPLDVLSSTAASFARGVNGIQATPALDKPEKTLELYEFEGCPFCRLVREVLTELDLDAVVYPCPKGGERYRPEVLTLGGKTLFPFLVDPNTGASLYESADIIEYLFVTYGRRDVPLRWQAAAIQKLGSTLASIPRMGAGVRARPSRTRPEQLLELYSFESSPFARLVRERLCEREIAYILHSAGRTTLSDWIPPVVRDALHLESSPELHNRRVLLARAGRVSIPYLVDPNTGTELAESGDILDYLEETYA